MDYQIHSRKFWLIAIGLLLGLLVLSQVSIPRVAAQSPTATVNTSAKDVHSAPDFAASKIDIVYQNQVVTLLGRTADSTWVYVNTPNAKTGWMTTTFISSSVPISTLPEVIVTTATPTGTPPTVVPATATHTAVPPVNATAVINTGKLNVRSGPGIEFAILTSVNNGATVNLLARNPEGTWALIRTSQAVDGWVNVKYIIPNVPIASLPVVGTAVTVTPGPAATVTPGPAAPTAVPGAASVTASTLNVRAAAGLSYARVDQVNYGNTVWVNGRNLDTSWISLITPDGVAGWVNAKYIASSINFSTLPVTSNTGTGIVLTGRLNVRAAPDPNSTILTSAPQGANMTLLGRTSDNTWLFLRAPDAKEGWSRTDFLGTTTNLNSLPVLAGPVPTSSAPTGPVPVPPIYVPPTTGNTAVLRACPNLGCAPTGSVYTGLVITATGRTGDSTWVYVSTSNGQQGWIPAQFVQLTIPVSSLPVKN